MATTVLDLSSDRTPEAQAEIDDLRLIESLRTGSEQAHEELLSRFQQPVYTLALRLLDDPAESSDVVQEVFLKVFRNIGHFRGQSSLEVFRVHACFCPLLPSHLWSLRPVFLYELRLRWATSQSEQASAFSDIGTSCIRSCLRLLWRGRFPRLLGCLKLLFAFRS